MHVFEYTRIHINFKIHINIIALVAQQNNIIKWIFEKSKKKKKQPKKEKSI
jgi:hypothetical protein